MLLDFIALSLYAAAAAAAGGGTGTTSGFRESSGTLSNTSKAHIDAQWGGHFTLGSSSRRYPVKRAALGHIELPTVTADCGGIDIFNGGMSFIEGQTIVDTLKSIGSGAKAYAFNLAIETISPQIASTIKWAQDLAQKVNLANIGSCEGAAALLGAVVPRNTKLHENTCKLMTAHTGMATDFVKSRNGCQKQKKPGPHDYRTATQNKVENELKAMGENVNIAWYVINQNEDWSHAVKETVMSVTGTVIIGGVNEKFRTFKPQALNDSFFKAFAEGGAAKVYTCDHDKCLVPKEEERIIHIHETHAHKVSQLLLSIEEKVYTDTELSNEEKHLVAETQVPILKIINIMSAHQRGKAPISINAYAEVIAHDLLTQHIRHMVSLVRQLGSDLKLQQINAEPLEHYIKQLGQIERKLEMRQKETNQKVNQILYIIEKAQVLEKELVANMRDLAGRG